MGAHILLSFLACDQVLSLNKAPDRTRFDVDPFRIRIVNNEAQVLTIKYSDDFVILPFSLTDVQEIVDIGIRIRLGYLRESRKLRVDDLGKCLRRRPHRIGPGRSRYDLSNRRISDCDIRISGDSSRNRTLVRLISCHRR